jgi:hypothetical protein
MLSPWNFQDFPLPSPERKARSQAGAKSRYLRIAYVCIQKNIVHRDIIWRFRQEEIDAVDDTWTFFSIFSTSFVAPGCRNELGKVEEAKELFCKAKEAPVSPKIPELDDGEHWKSMELIWKSYGNL